MSISIVYWSGTGNTEAMANALADGIREAGGEAALITVDSAGAEALASEEVFALGCHLWEQKSWRKARWSLSWQSLREK